MRHKERVTVIAESVAQELSNVSREIAERIRKGVRRGLARVKEIDADRRRAQLERDVDSILGGSKSW